MIKTRAIHEPHGAEEALTIIREQGGVELTTQLAFKYGRLSKEGLALIPQSSYRASLEGLVDFILMRTN